MGTRASRTRRTVLAAAVSGEGGALRLAGLHDGPVAAFARVKDHEEDVPLGRLGDGGGPVELRLPFQVE